MVSMGFNGVSMGVENTKADLSHSVFVWKEQMQPHTKLRNRISFSTVRDGVNRGERE